MSSLDDSDRGIPYRAILAPRALREAEAAYTHIACDSLVAAERWFADILAAVESLSSFPRRCPLAPEDERVRLGVRQLTLGNYRILFTINEVNRTVSVHLIRHCARRLAEPEEFTSVYGV